MDETNIRELESPVVEAKMIADALQPLGYEVRGFQRENRLGCYFVLNLRFVRFDHPFVFSGDDRRSPPADGEEVGTLQNPGNSSDSAT